MSTSLHSFQHLKKFIRPVGLAVLTGLTLLGAANTQGAITFTNLFSFNGTNGYNPSAPLLEVTPGNFYGTTQYGGTNTNSFGTLFHLSSDGTFSNILSFNGTNGAAPKSSLTLGQDGNLYGTTSQGGAFIYMDPNQVGYGTVFELATNNSPVLNNLASFNNTNGALENGLVQASNGLFYGTATTGGTTPSGPGILQGTLFTVTTNGVLNLLHSFDGTNGANPQAGLTLASNGLYYGSAGYGGFYSIGGFFSLATNGTYTFFDVLNGTNGSNPNGLVLAPDGSFYGTTTYGNTNFYGNLFRFTTNGVYQDLLDFNGTNGKYPTSIILATDGNFYGVTSQGGTYNGGTLFEFTTNNVFTNLYNFTGSADGYSPVALMQAKDGNFYGSTSYGGTYGRGTLFRFSTASQVIPRPVLQAIARTNTVFEFSWTAVSNHTYEVQYVTTAISTNWINLQAVTATNSVVTYFDAAATNSQRYYRLKLLN